MDRAQQRKLHSPGNVTCGVEMKDYFLETVGPEGAVFINCYEINAIVECDLEGVNETKVKSKIYVRGEEEPYNILEMPGEVVKKIAELI